MTKKKDIALVAYRSVKIVMRRRGREMVSKLELEKTYDCRKWCFLGSVLSWRVFVVN